MKKSNKYLLILFVGLIIITYFVLRKETGNISTNEITEKFVTFDSASVDKIEIIKKAEKIVIEKISGEWLITQPIKYSADQESVARLISETKEAKYTSLASSNIEKQILFQVDSSGTSAAFYEKGNKKDEFIVGKPGADYLSTYVRKMNSKDVYVINKSLSFEYSKQVKDWRNKNIFKIPLASINQIRYSYGDTIFSITKNQNGWIVDSDSANISSVQTLLTGISGINADDFVDFPLELPKLTAVINIISNNQDELRFYRFKDNTNKYYVQNSKSPQIYIMESYSAGNILKKKKDLVK